MAAKGCSLPVVLKSRAGPRVDMIPLIRRNLKTPMKIMRAWQRPRIEILNTNRTSAPNGVGLYHRVRSPRQALYGEYSRNPFLPSLIARRSSAAAKGRYRAPFKMTRHRRL